MDLDALQRASAAEGLGWPVAHAAEVSSTQDVVRAWAAAGEPHGRALIADGQVAGRGRLGRRWEAAPGDALLLSVLLRPGLRVDRLPLLALAAAVAVREACGPALRIKWPNDLLAPDGRKVAGLLAEVEGDAVVLGVGVNLVAAPLPTAACLAELGLGAPREALGPRLVAALLRAVERVRRDPAEVLQRWREGADTLGRVVRVGGVEGVAEDLGPDGALLVRTADGLRPVRAGDVEMIAGLRPDNG